MTCELTLLSWLFARAATLQRPNAPHIEIDRLCGTDQDVVQGNVDCCGVSSCPFHQVQKGETLLSFTTKPTAPMTRKPTPTAWQILMNSFRSAVVKFMLALWAIDSIGSRERLTLLAPMDELHAIFQELPRHVEDFLQLVCHGEELGVGNWTRASQREE